MIDVKHAAQLPTHDYWVFPHAIPAYLPLELDALPACVPYLRADAASAYVDALASRKHVLKVGLAFKGAPTHENDSERSLPSLDVLDSVLALDGIEFFSLQKGADEAAAYARQHANFHDPGASLHDMDDAAAAIAALDLVLTVDTSVAHVAGAMGKPTWLMLPFYGDWRWHFPRDDSPWYPTMRLFRRAYGRDWSNVVASVRDELTALRYRIAADRTGL